MKTFKSRGDAIRLLRIGNWELADTIPFKNKRTGREERVEIIYDGGQYGSNYYYIFYGLKLIGKRSNSFDARLLGERYARKLKGGKWWN